MDSFVVRVDAHDVELASDALWAAGVCGVEERRVGADRARVDLVAGFDVDVADGAARVRDAVAGRWEVEVHEVDPASWMDAWRPWARPTRVAGVVLQPPWVPAIEPGDDVVVELEPGHAWGHGAHPSTVLAAELLATAGLGPGSRVLDVGCGSGALSLIAAVRGASHVLAIDVDPEARRVTARNAARNGLADVVEVSDSLVDDITERYDLVVANLGVGVLAQLTPALLARSTPSGSVVLSGLLDGQATWSAATAAEVGRRVDRGWLAVRLTPV